MVARIARPPSTRPARSRASSQGAIYRRMRVQQQDFIRARSPSSVTWCIEKAAVHLAGCRLATASPLAAAGILGGRRLPSSRGMPSERAKRSSSCRAAGCQRLAPELRAAAAAAKEIVPPSLATDHDGVEVRLGAGARLDRPGRVRSFPGSACASASCPWFRKNRDQAGCRLFFGIESAAVNVPALVTQNDLQRHFLYLSATRPPMAVRRRDPPLAGLSSTRACHCPQAETAHCADVKTSRRSGPRGESRYGRLRRRRRSDFAFGGVEFLMVDQLGGRAPNAPAKPGCRCRPAPRTRRSLCVRVEADDRQTIREGGKTWPEAGPGRNLSRPRHGWLSLRERARAPRPRQALRASQGSADSCLSETADS